MGPSGKAFKIVVVRAHASRTVNVHGMPTVFIYLVVHGAGSLNRASRTPGMGPSSELHPRLKHQFI